VQPSRLHAVRAIVSSFQNSSIGAASASGQSCAKNSRALQRSVDPDRLRIVEAEPVSLEGFDALSRRRARI
jgi:hypothetical protein